MVNPIVIVETIDDQKVGGEIGKQHHFWCPACEDVHAVNVAPYHPAAPVWVFSGTLEAPTYSPSVRVRYGKDPSYGIERVCHFFIRNGRFEYCGDCTHDKAGQTVDMVPVPDWMVD